ncbi:uncharacterized protein LOC114280877 isoform X1 [Camellia sinensis]|uniref:uncharacterized protein LOC114280877 isoform X1 n=1 Tax=Camellia sinensis TaxID=4442 RepID=UPI00103676E3|nr:uncharacterized protein LOC114280877 isoform X1 [Camellia sinensis]
MTGREILLKMKEKVELGSSADTGKGQSKMSKHVTHGYHLVKGKSSHPMEDYVVAEFKQVEEHELGLFAIFDGHLSHDIPDYLRSHLFVNILNEPDFWTETEDAVRRAYRTTDTSILDKSVESTAICRIIALERCLQSKAISIGSRDGEKDMDNMAQRFRHEELPETWYTQFFESYKATKPYRLSFGDRETDKRTPELMSTYLRILKKHKRRRVAFKEDETNGFGNPMLENGSNMLRNSVLNDNDAIVDDTYFFPETMFPFNCVPDSALPHINRVEENHKVDFNGVLDMLPQIMTRSPIMIERHGIRPEYLSMEQGGNQCRGKNGSHRNRKLLSQEQASEMSRKVIARVLTNVGFEVSSEVPMEVLSQLLSCHIGKLGRILKVLSNSCRKQCSAIELLKMFLQIAGYRCLTSLLL